MAKAKYFHVKHKQSGAEHLVRAGRPADAIAAIAGDRSSAVLADQDAIADFYADGGEIHPNSSEAGNGKLFFVPSGDGKALVRAKNAGEAFGKINGSDLYDVELTTADQLVELLARRVPLVKFEGKQKPVAGAADAAGAAGDAPASSGEVEGATHADATSSEGAAAETDSAPVGESSSQDVGTESATEAEPVAANDEAPTDAAA